MEYLQENYKEDNCLDLISLKKKRKKNLILFLNLPNPRMSVLERTLQAIWSHCSNLVSNQRLPLPEAVDEAESELSWQDTGPHAPDTARRYRPPCEVHATSSPLPPLLQMGKAENNGNICWEPQDSQLANRKDQKKAE